MNYKEYWDYDIKADDYILKITDEQIADLVKAMKSLQATASSRSATPKTVIDLIEKKTPKIGDEFFAVKVTNQVNDWIMENLDLSNAMEFRNDDRAKPHEWWLAEKEYMTLVLKWS